MAKEMTNIQKKKIRKGEERIIIKRCGRCN